MHLLKIVIIWIMTISTLLDLYTRASQNHRLCYLSLLVPHISLSKTFRSKCRTKKKKRVLERWLLLLLNQAVGNVLNAAGDLVVVVVDAVLFGYTCRRSFLNTYLWHLNHVVLPWNRHHYIHLYQTETPWYVNRQSLNVSLFDKCRQSSLSAG